MTLKPGDLIVTGTPTGAGARFDPPKWLKPGDVVEVDGAGNRHAPERGHRGQMSDDAADRRAIRDLIENWVVWRDAGDWQRFRSVWHDDGRMMATWFQGSADDFIRVSREGFERGVSILHFLGGTSIELAGTRAFTQTKMTISQRAEVDGVLCDVVCTGRFCDFLEKRERALGDRAPPADLREGSHRPGRSGRAAGTRQDAARGNFQLAIATSPICRRGSATR